MMSSPCAILPGRPRSGLSEGELNTSGFMPLLVDSGSLSAAETFQCLPMTEMGTRGPRVVIGGVNTLPWPQWVQPTIDRLVDLLYLQPDWDSYGAHPIEKKPIEDAVSLLLQVMEESTPAPSVVPTSAGGVQIEWHATDLDLEIEFDPAGLAEAYGYDRRSGEEWEGEIPDEIGRVREAIGRLSS